MTIGTDTLATLTFPGANGDALPAAWTARFGSWKQNGSSGATYNSVAGDKVVTVDPSRANDNYSIKVQGGWAQGSATAGVILRQTNGTSSTSNGYIVIIDTGVIKIKRLTNGVEGSTLATCSPSATLAWTNGATISVETVGGDVVITASSTTGGGQSCTYTDVAANSPFPTGKPGLYASSNSTPAVYTGSVVITGTAAATGPTLSAGSPSNGSTTGAGPTIGATTDTASGTARIVIDSAANLSGVTATQIMSGYKAAGTAAAYDSGNITVSSTSISYAFGSIAAGSYTWAMAQGTTSNVLTGTIVVDATGPTFSAGPTTSSITATTATVGVTSSETGNAYVIVTSTAASQPADATFDASSFASAVTAATPATINVTGATQGALQKFWEQLKDAYGNRTTSSVIDLMSHTGYSRVVIGTPNTTAANRITATPDIASGDIIDWGNIVGTGTVVVNSDGTFDADVGVTAFTVYVGNTTDGWGSSAVQAVGGVASGSDTAPIVQSIRGSVYRSVRKGIR